MGFKERVEASRGEPGGAGVGRVGLRAETVLGEQLPFSHPGPRVVRPAPYGLGQVFHGAICAGRASQTCGRD